MTRRQVSELCLPAAARPGRPLRVSLVDRGGDLTTRYTPLALMYLRAHAAVDPALRDQVAWQVHAFIARDSIAGMVAVVAADAPDVVGVSCQGWNFVPLMSMLQTLRQLLPDAVLIVGGNHVTNQGNSVLLRYPWIDLVVNGEAEVTFRELLAALLEGRTVATILGLSYREGHEVVTTAERPRARSLDDIESAYLAADFSLTGYDVALIETNRGCPYHCSFCYWGGAVGARLARSSGLDRVQEELERIGAAGVPAVFVCDANFGILDRDVEIARLVVQTYRRFGAPAAFHVNWAKNNADRVGEIVAILQDAGMRTNVFVALQTLHPEALVLADRNEMGRKEMFDLADQMGRQGYEVGCELIFGLPGETLDEFRNSYDELFVLFPTLLVHPLWILPNTKYDERRGSLGLVTVRGDPGSDYEGVYQHSTLPIEANRAGLALLLADDVLVCSRFAGSVVRAAARLGPMRPTDVLERFERFVRRAEGELAAALRDAFRRIRDACYYLRDIRGQVRAALYSDQHRALALLLAFIDSLPLEPIVRDVCGELARLDCRLLPRADLDGAGEVESFHEGRYDAPALLSRLLNDPDISPRVIDPRPTRLCLRHRAGFRRYFGEAIDLSGTWMGRVVSAEPLGEDAHA